MSIEIIKPNTYLDNKIKPTIYLAGPVTKDNNWQNEAIEIINSYNSMSRKKLYILNPIGEKLNSKSQREWEYYHQNLSSRNGAIMFWFPENAEIIETKDDKLFESMLDIGYWTRAKETNPKINLSIGWDLQFYRNDLLMHHISINNLKYLQEDLEETCMHALRSLNINHKTE